MSTSGSMSRTGLMSRFTRPLRLRFGRANGMPGSRHTASMRHQPQGHPAKFAAKGPWAGRSSDRFGAAAPCPATPRLRVGLTLGTHSLCRGRQRASERESPQGRMAQDPSAHRPGACRQAHHERSWVRFEGATLLAMQRLRSRAAATETSTTPTGCCGADWPCSRSILSGASRP